MHALGRRVCYYDTDNIIYTVKKGEWEPPLGDHLGELTNELDDKRLDRHVCIGGTKELCLQNALR